MMPYYRAKNSGFALLMTLLVVSVIITVGLTILDVTIKQVRLSANAKDSETAFHAANAGLECAQYQRRVQSIAMENSATPSITGHCFAQPLREINTSGTTITRQAVVVSGAGARADRYSYQVSWGSGTEAKCSQIDTVIISAGAVTASVAAGAMTAIIPGYTGGGKTCPPGGVCTVLAIRGFNRPCLTTTTGPGSVFPAGTVQREVLLEY